MAHKLKLNNVNNSLLEAIKCRDVKGFRFDNTEYWKRYYQTKNKVHDFSREKRYAKFIKQEMKERKMIVDLASGYGFLPLELQKLGLNVVCVDKFPGMIEMAKKHFEANGEKLNMKQADIVNLPFENQSLNAVSAMSVLEHFPLSEIKEDVLPEIYRVLEPSGLLFVHMPVKGLITYLKKLYRMYIVKDLPVWACDDDGDVTHKIWFTSDQYLKLLQRSGFKVEFVTFNFIRSNESNVVIKTKNKLLSVLCRGFYPVKGNFSLSLKLLSFLATSVAFVCKKDKL